jgi:eukaryotic-like serine/threonine-protein kinase
MPATLDAAGISTTGAVATLNARGDAPSLDEWTLGEVLGVGSFATVFAAWAGGRSPSRAPYAVKLLDSRWERDASVVGFLRREAKAGRRARSRRLISVLATHVADPPYYLVMPRLSGVTLARRIDVGPIDLPVALWIARQAAEALAALAAAGWMHGDVSPANIVVDHRGHATLIDLGFARPLDEIGSAAERPLMGTVEYVSPETITSAFAADARSDFYSLGAVLYRMLTGRAPYPARDLAELATQHRQREALDVRTLAPHVPREVARLVHELLAKEPLRRPQSAGELIERLAGLEIACFGARGE